MARLMMFHALECPHCKRMLPLVDRLEKEERLVVEKYEIWHNEKNADLMRSYRDVLAPPCGGQLRTPTFFCPDSGDVMCGEVDYERLKAWARKNADR